MWRQGDVLIERVQDVPPFTRRVEGTVLARGELSGHAHRVAEAEEVELYEGPGETLYLRVLGTKATVVHDEHKAITLTRGAYVVRKQREYAPERYGRLRYISD